ncbi:DUF1206 domain-containing protein [Streptomyces roseus]|uniref:DUF1206 domain-containing protein n=1 Tax=Streptomyces roseus TaxID=66430 RepID=UPI003820A80A
MLVGILAVRIVLGSDSGQEADRSGAVGTIGEQPFGRALLWALVVGLAAMTLWRRVVAVLGIVGGVACGVVAAGAGLSILPAAVRYDPSQAKGLDETLRSFAATPAGPALLIAAAVGLLLFGLYSFCEARWRKAAEHGTPAEQPTGAAGPRTRPGVP